MRNVLCVVHFSVVAIPLIDSCLNVENVVAGSFEDAVLKLRRQRESYEEAWFDRFACI